MCAPLARVMVCGPENGGWQEPARFLRWQELGFLEPPDLAAAQQEHDTLCKALAEAGADVVAWIPAGPGQISLDAIYVHDPSFMTDAGAVLLSMGKRSREGEVGGHAQFYADHDIPVLGSIQPPGKVEGGDLVWLGARTLLAGTGYRTNRHGIDQLRELLQPQKVEIIPAPLPHSGGPSVCLHLMSLLSVLDEKTVLVDQPWLSVQTVELLQELGFRSIEIEVRERETMACNVLSLGNRRLLALEGNPGTSQRLKREGFQTITVPGRQIGFNGGGGPTCLTRPLLRRTEASAPGRQV
jgi:dimethylargininase